jgi:uncharacterized membrane protein YhaH (DUF805 family)
VSELWHYVDQNRQTVGPLSTEALKTILLNLPDAKNALVWHAGFTDWKRAGEVPELSVDPSAPPPPPFAERAVPMAPGVNAGNQTDILNLWFSFKGRINRGKYWLVSLINLAILVVVVAAGWVGNSELAWILALAAGLAFFVSQYAVGAKRLHDRNKSAWWLLFYYVLPAIISPTGGYASTGGVAILWLVSLGISIAAFVDLGCLKGTTGPNRFGPDPLAGRV